MKKDDNRLYSLWIAGLVVIIAAVVAILFLYTAHIQRSIISSHEQTNRLYHRWLLFKESVYTAEYALGSTNIEGAYQRIDRSMDELSRDFDFPDSARTIDDRQRMYATVFNQWKDLAGEIEKVVAASEEGAWPDLIELLRSPLGKSFESNLASLERLTFVHTNEQLHRLRIMSYAVMIVMAFFVFGFLSFLIVGRERLHGEQRVRRLTQSLLKRLEDERKQMSFDLHDVLFQDLASVKMKCQNMLEDAREDIQVGQEQLEAVVGELQELIRVTRGITGTMKPKRLEHFGLAGGIRALCNDISTHTDLDIRFFAVGLEAVDIEFDTEINLYRVTQEFLRHVRLYSEADRISVRLIASSPKLYLRIHDNGNGINPFKKRRAEAASPDEQLRLITIEERVRMLNGEITVESAPGKGTEYKIGVPLRRSETAAEAAASG